MKKIEKMEKRKKEEAKTGYIEKLTRFTATTRAEAAAERLALNEPRAVGIGHYTRGGVG